MIVIPMAGMSQRFIDAGYGIKYKLLLNGRSVFSHSINSFSHYFNRENMLFIARDTANMKEFIDDECNKLGLQNYDVVLLDKETGGQADTVYQGLKKMSASTDEPLTIFNIDTFRKNFRHPDFVTEDIDGYLETFVGTGKNWSNIVPSSESTQTVEYTAEKKEVSEYCCTGLYYWKKAQDFISIFESYQELDEKELDGGELYIAPMYNYLIQKGGDVRYCVISKSEVTFCGVPAEYEQLKNTSF